MSFVYPLGLIGLIGIPILIIIYIIKNKYTEQTIASIYIWQLSEKFLKRKKPISKLQGLIALILQCATVLFLSLLIAQPSLVIKNGANDYCFILDASASMSKQSGETTRFDLAKEKIKDMVNDSKSGSSYTLIYSGTDTSTVFDSLSNKERAISLLNDLTCSSVSQTVDDAIKQAQTYFDKNRSLKTYLVTDKNYEVNNIDLINVSNGSNDYQILSSTYTLTETTYNADGTIDKAANLHIEGTFISYDKDVTLNLEVLVDDESKDLKDISVSKNEVSNYSFDIPVSTFEYYEVRINDNDDLIIDNSYFVYNLISEHNYKALIVSKRPFYFEALLDSYSKLDSIDSITIEEYEAGSYTGYGLYIFDTSSMPSTLPTDGTLWLFNPKQSIESSGFSWNDSITSDTGFTLERETVYGDYKDFLSHYIDSNNYKLTVKNYNKYTINRNFTTLFSVDSSPVIFIGNTTNKAKNREIVFGFDIRESNLAMNYNSLILFRKLLDYSFPTAVSSNEIVSGTEFSYNVISGTKNIRLTSPSGVESYIDISNSVGTIAFSEVGTYTISYTMENGEIKKFNVYSAFPKEENISEDNLVASLGGVQESNYKNGSYDLSTILFVFVVLLFIADWMVYCYEQHQLF